jgi:hypothetical protein
MVADWPGAKVTEMCDAFVLPVAVIVVEPVKLLTERVTDFVTLLPIVKDVGDAVKVHGPVG